jgi:hypothetical protein
MTIYCSYGPWLLEHNKKFYSILTELCMKPDDIRCNTLISPNADLLKKLGSISTKAARRDALKLCNALQIQIDLHDKSFTPGTYKNNLGQGFQISAPSNGTFEIKSGRGFNTSCKVKLVSNFDVDYQFRSDEDRHMCIVELVSGDIATDGDMFTGTQMNRPVRGSSEMTTSGSNMRLESWKAIEHATNFELRNKQSLDEAQSRLCGLLKLMLMKVDSVPEYAQDAQIVHTALCYEPLASLYILLQPHGERPLLNSRFDKDWCFAPYICEDPHGLYSEFCSKFPCSVDQDERAKLVAEVINTPGISKIDELQDAYEQSCNKLFGNINYPCGQKLWADEVCYYICVQMKQIRANHDAEGFYKLCKNLENVYPGKDHKAESKFGSEEYWNGIEMSNEIKEVGHFAKSFCCLQCSPNGGELAESCKPCLRPLKPSCYMRVLMELNA